MYILTSLNNKKNPSNLYGNPLLKKQSKNFIPHSAKGIMFGFWIFCSSFNEINFIQTLNIELQAYIFDFF